MNRKQKRQFIKNFKTSKAYKGFRKKHTKGVFGKKSFLSNLSDEFIENNIVMLKPTYNTLKVIPKSKRTPDNSNSQGVQK